LTSSELTIKSKYSKISQSFRAFSIVFLGLDEQTAVFILCSLFFNKIKSKYSQKIVFAITIYLMYNYRKNFLNFYKLKEIKT